MTQLIIILVYLGLLLALGLIASRLFRGTSEDYLLASHSIGPFLLLMSLFGTTMTAFALAMVLRVPFDVLVSSFALRVLDFTPSEEARYFRRAVYSLSISRSM